MRVFATLVVDIFIRRFFLETFSSVVNAVNTTSKWMEINGGV